MNRFSIAICVIALCATEYVHAQTVYLECFFFHLNNEYTCQILNQNIPGNDENINIEFIGDHLVNRTNADVRRVEIQNSRIPFIPEQLFDNFENVRYFSCLFCSIERIQTNAFRRASSLEILSMWENPIRTVHGEAFMGADNLRNLFIFYCPIESFSENAFSGLTNLEILRIVNSSITELPVNILRPLPNLIEFTLFNSLLQKISGEMFANNRLLETVSFTANRINAIGRTFLDHFSSGSLRSLAFLFNNCTNSQWTDIDFENDKEIIRTTLAPCFNNAENEWTRFILDIRGSLVLRYENGTEVIRV